jgi:hypothetical protein
MHSLVDLCDIEANNKYNMVAIDRRHAPIKEHTLTLGPFAKFPIKSCIQLVALLSLCQRSCDGIW